MIASHIILASLPSFCKQLSKLVEIWQSSDKNKFAKSHARDNRTQSDYWAAAKSSIISSFGRQIFLGQITPTKSLRSVLLPTDTCHVLKFIKICSEVSTELIKRKQHLQNRCRDHIGGSQWGLWHKTLYTVAKLYIIDLLSFHHTEIHWKNSVELLDWHSSAADYRSHDVNQNYISTDRETELESTCTSAVHST